MEISTREDFLPDQREKLEQAAVIFRRLSRLRQALQASVKLAEETEVNDELSRELVDLLELKKGS